MATIIVTTDGQTVQVKSGDTVVVDIPGGGTVNIEAMPDVNVKIFRVDFGDDDKVSDTVNIELSTFTNYGLHIDINNYDTSDVVSLGSAFGTYVDSGNEDEYNFSYVGANGATFDGYIRAKDNGEDDFTGQPPPVVICFCQGTAIDTEIGSVPVESLAIGDLIQTKDNEPKPLKWIGKRILDSLDLARYLQLRPVLFSAGSLGQGLPYAYLAVSPQHRMFLSGWRTELHFGTAEMLIPAISFVDGNKFLVQKDMPSVTYYHLMFDAHEIVTANGVASESLHASEMALASMSNAAQEELNLIFPDGPAHLPNRKTARPVTRRTEAVVAHSAA